MGCVCVLETNSQPQREDYCSYMRINHTLTCVLHRHGHALCALRDKNWNINERCNMKI